MSYDLFFCTEIDKSVTKEAISEYLVHLPYITNEWNYNNPHTGVYFSFLHSPPSSENEIETVIPSGYSDSNLSFSINYLRPKFFAEEAMPYVEQLCNTFGFLIIDPQDHIVGGNNSPKKAKADNLIESWTQNNKVALSVYRQQRTLPPYLSRETSLEWWKHQSHVERIQNVLGDSIYVPNILLFADTDNNKVITAVAWTEAIPFIFPKCDIVIIVRHEQKGLFRRDPKLAVKGWIEAAEVKDKISRYMQNIETEIGLLPALLPEKSPKVKGLFVRLKTNPMPEKYIRIAPDSMVDEEVS